MEWVGPAVMLGTMVAMGALLWALWWFGPREK